MLLNPGLHCCLGARCCINSLLLRCLQLRCQLGALRLCRLRSCPMRGHLLAQRGYLVRHCCKRLYAAVGFLVGGPCALLSVLEGRHRAALLRHQHVVVPLALGAARCQLGVLLAQRFQLAATRPQVTQLCGCLFQSGTLLCQLAAACGIKGGGAVGWGGGVGESASVIEPAEEQWLQPTVPTFWLQLIVSWLMLAMCSVAGHLPAPDVWKLLQGRAQALLPLGGLDACHLCSTPSAERLHQVLASKDCVGVDG